VTGIQKNSIAIALTREQLLDMGAVTPTPEEAAEIRRDREAFDQKKKAAQPRLHAALARLDAITDPLARDILDLHARDEADAMFPECLGCDYGGYEGEPPVWPCRTVELIAARHGIDISDFHLYDPKEDQ